MESIVFLMSNSTHPLSLEGRGLEQNLQTAPLYIWAQMPSAAASWKFETCLRRKNQGTPSFQQAKPRCSLFSQLSETALSSKGQSFAPLKIKRQSLLRQSFVHLLDPFARQSEIPRQLSCRESSEVSLMVWTFSLKMTLRWCPGS